MNSGKLNIIFIGESYIGGMAGSKRIQNVINAFLKLNSFKISNLIVHNPNEVLPVVLVGQKNQVKYQIIYYSLRNPFTFIKFYYNAFNFIIKNRDQNTKNILYCYDNPTPFNYIFILFAKSKNYKIVVDIVEDYSLVQKNQLTFKQKIAHAYQTRLLKKLPKYVDGILTISKYLTNFFANRISNQKPIFYLPATVDLTYFINKTSKNELITKIFYGGSFGEKDGLIYLLEAFEEVAKQHPEMELILTGKPPKSGMNTVLSFISKSEFKSRIKYLGYLSDESYYRVMCECDIFCMTRVDSKYAHAGFPFKLCEMLATGKPVIATQVSNVSDYLKDKENAILIKPNSVAEIVSSIEFIINNPIVAMKIGDAGKKTAETFFDTDALVNDLSNFLFRI